VTPISSISVEAVRFDMQQMENPEISGIEYQQGTLAGYECREYLLEKWGRKCAYCDAENVPLQIEHIQPKGRRGSDRISNLTLACRPCNPYCSKSLLSSADPVEVADLDFSCVCVFIWFCPSHRGRRRSQSLTLFKRPACML
jgi:hypothetical protein